MKAQACMVFCYELVQRPRFHIFFRFHFNWHDCLSSLQQEIYLKLRFAFLLLSANKLVNQAITVSTPKFTPKNVNLGVFYVLLTVPAASTPSYPVRVSPSPCHFLYHGFHGADVATHSFLFSPALNFLCCEHISICKFGLIRVYISRTKLNLIAFTLCS